MEKLSTSFSKTYHAWYVWSMLFTSS